MREIKFRQFDIKLKKWHYFGFKDGNCSGVLSASLKRYPIMQYIGLKDAHKNPIYEGDIIKWISYNYEVKYHHMHAKYIFGKDDLTKGVAMSSEIIGNIYENGDLLND